MLAVSCAGEQPEKGDPTEGSTGITAEQTGAGDAGGTTGGEEASGTTVAETETGDRKALVPIAHLSSLEDDVSLGDLAQDEDLAVPKGLDGVVDELLGRTGEFAFFDTTASVVDHVGRTPDAVGIVPWDAVGPEVKALSVDGVALLAPETPAGYPLSPNGATGPDRDGIRRVVAAGDVVLDRGQNYTVIQQGLGLDFPLSGGYAAVTQRTPVESGASEFGVIHEFEAERGGGAGAVREYLRGADLTLANFENPVIEDAVWHPDEPVFTGDLRLLPILNSAGIDGVTLANNHILDAGAEGLGETLGHLEEARISYAGAGADLDAAREPMVFDLNGLAVGVLSYQNVPSYEWAWAGEASPGTAPLDEGVLREDVEELEDDVDLVVVMPHWGSEYTATPEPGQVELAHAAIDAGADLVVGDHAHWPKGIEVYEGKPIFYGTGNFLFDQSWSEETSTGIFVEATLLRDRVVQARPVPFIILDKAQPNFLLPNGGRERALQTIYGASLGPEFEAYDD